MGKRKGKGKMLHQEKNWQKNQMEEQRAKRRISHLDRETYKMMEMAEDIFSMILSRRYRRTAREGGENDSI